MGPANDCGPPSRDVRRLSAETVCLIVVLGLCAAGAIHYVLGVYGGRQYPYNTFLFRPVDEYYHGFSSPLRVGRHFFGDFYSTFVLSKEPSPYLTRSVTGASSYFPFTHVLLRPFTVLGPVLSFGLLVTCYVIAFPTMVAKALKGLNTQDRVRLAILTTLPSYPVLFVIDRGNIDGLVAIFMGLSIFAFYRERFPAAAIWLGIAAAIKGYPLALLLLFLQRKRWREAGLALAVTASLTLVSLATFKGGLVENYRAFGSTLTQFVGSVELAEEGELLLQHNSSLYAFSETLSRELREWQLGFLAGPFDSLSEASFFVGVAGLLGLGYLFLAYEVELREKTLLIMVAIVLLLKVSFDYRLVLLFPPLCLYLREDLKSRTDRLVLVLIALLLVPKSYPVLFREVGIGVLVNPVLLCCVAALVTVTVVARRRSQQLAECPMVLEAGWLP